MISAQHIMYRSSIHESRKSVDWSESNDDWLTLNATNREPLNRKKKNEKELLVKLPFV